MSRRVKALLLLLIAVATCASQGLSMALCRCTGDVYVGAVPESCCGECPEESDAGSATLQAAAPQADGCRMLTSRDDCWVVVSKGWESYLPASSKEQAPAPVLAVVEPFATLLLMPSMPRQAPVGLPSWRLTHESDPPGPSRVVLYRSLLI
jgi:hypothetical protein